MSATMQLTRYAAPAFTAVLISSFIVPQSALPYIAAGFPIKFVRPIERIIVTASSLYGINTPGHDNHTIANNAAGTEGAALRRSIHRYGDLPSTGLTFRKQCHVIESETLGSTDSPIGAGSGVDSDANSYVTAEGSTDTSTSSSAGPSTEADIKEPQVDMFSTANSNADQSAHLTVTSTQTDDEEPNTTDVKTPSTIDALIVLPTHSKKPQTTGFVLDNEPKETLTIDFTPNDKPQETHPVSLASSKWHAFKVTHYPVESHITEIFDTEEPRTTDFTFGDSNTADEVPHVTLDSVQTDSKKSGTTEFNTTYSADNLITLPFHLKNPGSTGITCGNETKELSSSESKLTFTTADEALREANTLTSFQSDNGELQSADFTFGDATKKSYVTEYYFTAGNAEDASHMDDSPTDEAPHKDDDPISLQSNIKESQDTGFTFGNTAKEPTSVESKFSSVTTDETPRLADNTASLQHDIKEPESKTAGFTFGNETKKASPRSDNIPVMNHVNTTEPVPASFTFGNTTKQVPSTFNFSSKTTNEISQLADTPISVQINTKEPQTTGFAFGNEIKEAHPTNFTFSVDAENAPPHTTMKSCATINFNLMYTGADEMPRWTSDAPNPIQDDTKKPQSTSFNSFEATAPALPSMESTQHATNCVVTQSEPERDTVFTTKEDIPVMLTQDQHNRRLAQPRSRKTAAKNADMVSGVNTIEQPTQGQHHRKFAQPHSRKTVPKNIDMNFGANTMEHGIFDINPVAGLGHTVGSAEPQLPSGSYALTPSTYKLEPECIDMVALTRIYSPFPLKKEDHTTLPSVTEVADSDSTVSSIEVDEHTLPLAQESGSAKKEIDDVPSPSPQPSLQSSPQQQQKGSKRTGKKTKSPKSNNKTKGGKRRNGKAKK